MTRVNIFRVHTIHVDPGAVRGKAALVMLKTEVHDHVLFRIRMDELRRLVSVLGLSVTGEFVQTELVPRSRFLVGAGKVRELGNYVEKHDVDVVVFYNTLKSSQKLNLMQALDCDVVDRYEVILEIFDAMASDTISKLQIEAAKLENLYPFYKLQASVKFRTEKPFFRSMGEYAYHNQVRALTGHLAAIRKKIQLLRAQKKREIRRRRRLGYPSICIAGYYNAGKTSLFNCLTGEMKKVSDRPFTTLSSKYQRRFFDNDETLLFIDTIGFVIDLDPRLVKSFDVSLEDMRSSDVVLLLLELSEPLRVLSLKLRSGLQILEDLDIEAQRVIVVFNKTDLLSQAQIDAVLEQIRMAERGLDFVCVSASQKTNLDSLIVAIRKKIEALRSMSRDAPVKPPIVLTEQVDSVLQTRRTSIPAVQTDSRTKV